MSDISKIRNIAIVAHVDHGKTTLVDQLLKQSGTFRENQDIEERVMDSMDLEREKGITIKAKNACIKWNDHTINIVDTPGHADFGGEVERVMKMIDGVLLLVDAFEGPQAQTKFVLQKALECGARPIVVVNKIDRPNARPHEVLDMVFELFLSLNATDEQLDFPAIYASARDGYAVRDWKGEVTDECRNAGMISIYEAIEKFVPQPILRDEAFFSMLVANLDWSDYVGRIAFGKIYSGSVKVGDSVVCLHSDGTSEKNKVTKLFSYEGMQRVEVQEVSAGSIVGLAGLESVFIGETITDQTDREALPFVAIDPPTIAMQFLVNDSPFAGRAGKFLTARHIKDRLVRETRVNVSLQVEDSKRAGAFNVRARGEMQVAVIVEQMRREGYELMVSRPQVILEEDESGKTLEPIENLYIDVPSDALGDVLQNLAGRKGEVKDMRHQATSVIVEAEIPTRGVIGLETDIKNLTRGMGIMSHMFKEYGEFRGEIAGRKNGVLVAMEDGTTAAYSLDTLQARAKMFVDASEEVYSGMVVGENSRSDDMVVNPCKTKQLTNMRSSGDGKGIQLEPPVKMSLERMIEYIAGDEFVEATPDALRIRKQILDHTARKRAGNKNKAQ
ncbi:MAG: translational GTPase TypA [Verrucomicrobiota bacterium]